MRLGILASGRGSNLQALLDARTSGRLTPPLVEIAVVGSDVPGAPALTRASEARVPVFTIDPGSSRARLSPTIEAEFVDQLHRHGVDWVVLAGFFRIIGAPLLGAFPDRILNIHPSLLPSFPGLRAQRQALEHGVRVTGCTVHLVDAGVDEGAILAQTAVPVEAGDDEASLSDRILRAEHPLLVETVARIARVGFRREGRRVRWGDEIVGGTSA